MNNELNDLHLLKFFCTKDNYDKYIHFVRLECLSNEIRTILLSFKKYYEYFSKDLTDFEEFFTWFSQIEYSSLHENTIAIYKEIVSRLAGLKDYLGKEILLEYEKRAVKKKIEDSFLLGFDKDFLKQQLAELDKNLIELEDKDDESVFKCDNVEELFHSTDKEQGLRWRLNFLNENIGGVKKGMLIVVAAYVNVGKTAFVCSEVTNMASQLKDGVILWLNNEEYESRVALKLYQSALNATYNDLRERPSEAQDAYRKKMHGDKDRIKIVDISKKTLLGIRALFEKYRPKLVVIDQASNINNTSRKSFSEQDNLKTIFQSLRDMSKEYCPIIAICQASSANVYNKGDKTEYVLYPDFSNLYYSKVGIQGTADVILMIGRRSEESQTRGLVIGKSKFCGEKKQEVIFDVDRIRYKNV